MSLGSKELVARNASVYSEFLASARNTPGRSMRSTATWLHMAAESAWRNHPGFFADRELEAALQRVAVEAKPYPNRSSQGVRPGDVRSILHVLTQGYDEGGHTRLLANWMRWDRASRHAIALTRQLSPSLPRAIAAAGVEVTRLDEFSSSVPEKAAYLRSLSKSSDLVLLHTHPSDVVPLVAYADPTGLPPIALINHADHVFWVGGSICNAVACLRRSGARLAADRRGLPGAHLTLLPLPLGAQRRDQSLRSATRSTCGIGDDAVLLVTAASPYKFARLSNLDFVAIHGQILEACPGAVLLVAGTNSLSGYADLPVATRKRFRFAGYVMDLAALRAAADIYLEAFPIGSLTATLEFGLAGVPIVSYMYPATASGRMLRTQEDELGPHGKFPHGVEAYAATVASLARDAALRKEIGEATRQHLLRSHAEAGWVPEVENFYRFIYESTRLTLNEPLRATDELDALLAGVHAASAFAHSAQEIKRQSLGLLPLGERLAVAASLGGHFKAADLLSDALRLRLKQAAGSE